MKDLSVVIASRGQPMGLWYSLESVEIEAKVAGIDFDFSIVTNGEEKLDIDTRQVLKMLKTTGRLAYHRHHPEALTPQLARQEAIDNTDSKYVLCVDNHVLLCPNFIKRALLVFEKFDCDFLHSATRYYQDDAVCYNYRLRLTSDFWGVSDAIPQHEYKPFKIASAGHGAFFLKRKSFEDIGGYYLSSGFKGYAGEENTTNLSAWMLDKTIWIDPQIEHRHYAAATRGYARHLSADFFMNLFSSAFIVAGETSDKYVYKMLEHFGKTSKPLLKKSMYELLIEAKERSKPFVQWLKEKRKRTFEEQLEIFRKESIAH